MRTKTEKMDLLDYVEEDEAVCNLVSALISDELHELIAAGRDAWVCHHWDEEDEKRKASLERLITALKPFDAVMV